MCAGPRALWSRARRQLAERGERAGEMKLGAMIEVPSAALMAPELAREVDFASIGTNDLCQYLTAADRMNPAVAPVLPKLASGAVPPYRHGGTGIRAGGQAPLRVRRIGRRRLAAPALVGLGLRKLSMSASSLARVKRRLRV